MYLLDLHDIRQESNFFQAERHRDVACNTHLHYSMEIVCVTEGTVVMEVSGKIRTINAGQGTLVLPYEPHSFETPEGSSCFVILFSPELMDDFYTSIRNKMPGQAVCVLSPWTLEMCDKNLPVAGSLRKEHSSMQVKAVLYPLCDEFLSKCNFEESPNPGSKAVFTEALKYISANFRNNDTSLAAVANALGIHHVYLSRVFHQSCGVHYTKYVNMLRCFYAIRMLRDYPERSISEIALDAGFGSIRSFNREFQSIYGMTPHEKRFSPNSQ